jgi:precorrin-3B synthase
VAPLRQSDTDACPGALRLHTAADGLLARVRLPAGVLSGAQLHALRELADSCGDGFLELTSRANLQLRGVKAEDAETLAAGLRAAGLLPSETHDPVRNIAAPPLAGSTVRALVGALDAAILSDPELPRLPGKFLFAIGHVPLAADVAAVPVGPGPVPPPTDRSIDRAGGTRFALWFGGHDTGLRAGPDQVVPALIAAAHAFLAERGEQKAWRLRELTDGPARISARVAAGLGLVPAPIQAAAPVEALESGGLLGVLEQPDGPLLSVGALVPLGKLGPVHMKALEKADRLVITPWRGVLVTDLPAAVTAQWTADLIDSGLALDARSPWVGVTACAGRPGCAKSLADVRADAAATSAFVDGLPAHWAGCDRACGSPAGAHVRVLATPAGYRVSRAGATTGGDRAGSDVTATDRDLGDVVAEARRV